jgi:hypothetical protein
MPRCAVPSGRATACAHLLVTDATGITVVVRGGRCAALLLNEVAVQHAAAVDHR